VISVVSVAIQCVMVLASAPLEGYSLSLQRLRRPAEVHLWTVACSTVVSLDRAHTCQLVGRTRDSGGRLRPGQRSVSVTGSNGIAECKRCSQCSPARTGMAMISVPVVTTSPALTPPGTWLSSHRKASRGPPRTSAPLPVATCGTVSEELAPGIGQWAKRIGSGGRLRSDSECGVEARVGDRLRGGQLPVGEVALHDLESGGDPAEGASDCVNAGTFGHGRPKTHDDLRLDPRGDETGGVEVTRAERLFIQARTYLGDPVPACPTAAGW